MPINTLDPDETVLLLGHYTGKVILGWWSTPFIESKGQADYDNKDLYKLYWNIEVLDVLQENYDGVVPPTVTRSWGIGKGWWADEKGTQVRHNDDASDDEIENGVARPRTFRVESGLGKFLGMLKGSVDGYDTDFGPPLVMDEGGKLEYDLGGVREYLVSNSLTDSRDATIWNGMVFEFRGLGLKYSEDRKPFMNALPVKFLGVGDVEILGTSQTASGQGTSSSSPATDAHTWEELGATEAQAGMLVRLAASAASHSEFSRNALLLPDLSEELQGAVMDEILWSS